MELTNQFVTAEINKTAAIVVKLPGNLFDRGHTVWWTIFIIGYNRFKLHVVTGKMFFLQRKIRN
jgi:hypothetical protein